MTEQYVHIVCILHTTVYTLWGQLQYVLQVRSKCIRFRTHPQFLCSSLSSLLVSIKVELDQLQSHSQEEAAWNDRWHFRSLLSLPLPPNPEKLSSSKTSWIAAHRNNTERMNFLFAALVWFHRLIRTTKQQNNETTTTTTKNSTAKMKKFTSWSEKLMRREASTYLSSPESHTHTHTMTVWETRMYLSPEQRPAKHTRTHTPLVWFRGWVCVSSCQVSF